jgi:sialidase-1
MQHLTLTLAGLSLACCLAASAIAAPEGRVALSWSELPQLPPAPGQEKQAGLAGPFAGPHNGVLIVAGGANFPDKPPWDGGAKVWWDDIYVLQRVPDATYRWLADESFKLPRPLAYGVSITTRFGVVCIGGCDAEQCYPDVFALQWDPARQSVRIESFPPLPVPLGFMAGALVGDTIYVAGGQETMKDASSSKRFFALDLSEKDDGGDFGWRELPAWPGPPRVLSIAAAQSNGATECFYLFSGRNVAPGQSTDLLTDAYCYNPETQRWTRLADTTLAGDEPRCIMAGTGIASGSDRILVFGGAVGAVFRGLEQLATAIAWTKDESEAEVLEKKQRDILENHGGFSRDILSYSTLTDTWSKIGELPMTSSVTTTALRWRDWIVIPTGEIHPGIRTPKIWKAWESRLTGDAMLEKTDLYEVGQEGYLSYRIPAMVVTKNGSLLVFCAARRQVSDWADIDIMVRRSTDGGRTWEPPRVIARRQDATVDNPVPIVDRLDGAVHFLHQVDYRQCFYMRSDDDGLTFSEPVDITATFEQFRPEYDWTVLAPGPGHGIQLQSGRLVVPLWLSNGGGKAHRPSCVSTIYSDDHGRTWQRGEIVVMSRELTPNPSESVAIELSDGRVMLNIRCESRGYRRLIAYSPDGATNWSQPEFDEELFDPICMASLIRLSSGRGSKGNRILFANPNSGDHSEIVRLWGSRPRQNTTIRLSYDEGQTWPVAKLLEPGRSGYSDLAVGPDGEIYCVYERGFSADNQLNNRYLTVARLNLEWLTDGDDSLR